MRRTVFTILVPLIFFLGCAGQETVPPKDQAAIAKAPPAEEEPMDKDEMATPKGPPPAERPLPANLEETYRQAEAAFKEKNYDETVRLLSGPAFDDPGAWKINLLLAKAQTEQCALLKAKGDKSYEDLIKTPYNKVRLMNLMNPYHPEPYYIASKCLLINGYTDRAARNSRKALKLAPTNPDYWRLKAEICEELARQNPSSSHRYTEEAQKAYEMERQYEQNRQK